MKAPDGPIPTFERWLAGVPEGSRAVIRALDRLALGVDGARREIHWDGLARDFTPSYKLGGRELFHVHPDGESGAGITFSVSAAKLEPRIDAEPSIEEALRREIRASKSYRGTRWVFLACASEADVARLAPLVRCKADWIADGAK